jgi:spore germination protein KC
MSKAGKFLFALSALLLLSGCWNRVELNELSVIMGTAVDVEDDQWVVTFQVVVPQSIATQTGGGAGSSQPPVSVFSTNGKTLAEAVRRISLEASRTPFFAHNRVIIISEKAAREKGVSQIVDFYLRDGESRETVDIALSRGNARNLLEVLNPQEKIPAIAIDRIFMETQQQLSFVKRIRLSEFAAMLAAPTTSAVAPEIRYTGDPNAKMDLDQLKQVRQKGVLKIGDIGIFRHDKLAGWMGREESIGIAWLANNMETSMVSFDCPGQGPDGRKSSFRVERSHTDITPVISGDHVTIKVRIDTKGTLNESGCGIDLSKPENIRVMEDQIQKQIQREITVSWKKAQELKADVFRFGEQIHNHHPKKWKDLQDRWYDILPEVELENHIHVEIKRTGMINDSFSNIVKE